MIGYWRVEMGTSTGKLAYCLRIIRREEPPAEREGSCDAVLLLTIVFPPAGVPRANFSSVDGRNGRALPNHDIFSAWLALAKLLSTDERMDDEQRAFAEQVYKAALDRDRRTFQGSFRGAPEA
jgi:hypothetical protein